MLIAAPGANNMKRLDLFIILYYASVVSAQDDLLVLQPSGQWEGYDGPWSTFHIKIGSQGQKVTVLPSMSLSDIWTFSCTTYALDPNARCINVGGEGFSVNASSSWDSPFHDGYAGPVPLNEADDSCLWPVEKLGYSGFAVRGVDGVVLPLSSSNGTILSSNLSSAVAVLSTDQHGIGILGIAPKLRSCNLSDRHHFIKSIWNANPRLRRMWSYTAGEFASRIPASLSIGGYDAARFDPKSTITLDMPQDSGISEFPILINNISIIDGTTMANQRPSIQLLAEPIDATIDSLLPHIWLPTRVCKIWEEMLDIKADEKTGLYLVNESTHQKLQSRNLTIQFTVQAPGPRKNGKTKIIFSYSSLSLNITPPLVSENIRYLPLRCTANKTQYVLGRAFLQRAYLSADYHYREFNLSSVRLDVKGETRLTALNWTDWSRDHPIEQPVHKTMNGGGIAGIVIGLCIAALAGWYVFAYRTNRPPFAKRAVDKTFQKRVFLSES